MRVFFDTSVLVAAMVQSYTSHSQALSRLKRVQDGLDSGIVAAHSIAELYSILTRLPIRPPISALNANKLIQENILRIFEIIALDAKDYQELVDYLATNGVIGGAVFDAVILKSAEQMDVDQILTLNEKDFRRVYPSLAHKLAVP